MYEKITVIPEINGIIDSLSANEENIEAVGFLHKAIASLEAGLVKNDMGSHSHISVEEERRYIDILKKDGLRLRDMKEQTHTMCMAAVMNNGLALEFVEKQDVYICLAAIKHTPGAGTYVEELAGIHLL